MRKRSGFTIVELLVVVSIIALLIGILLPAIGKARDQARLSISRTNLRQLGLAAAAYANEWQDRQVTYVNDNIGRYGNTMIAALSAFQQENGQPHPPVITGLGPGGSLWGWWFGNPSTYGELLNPIAFTGNFAGFGWFRNMNVRPFTAYLNGRAYDPIFYAPKDRVPLSVMDDCFDQPYEYRGCYDGGGSGGDGDGNVIWPSYCWSPAALYSPDVFDPDGFVDPITLNAGYRVPSMGHAAYSDLKTHMVEHHWLQNTHADCNPVFAPGNYEGCEPYYFNHGRESVPMTLFYDGHVEGLGVMEAQAASSRAAQQTGGMGLWHTGTPFGTDGYFISDGWDTTAATSFHILTTDGITGRDKLGG